MRGWRVPLAFGLALAALPAAALDVASSTARSSQQSGSAVDATTRDLSQIWGLSIDEIRRYQALMRGYRGAVSTPQISPIEVLGIHARDEAERRKYAELLARIMVQDAERVLAFERERLAAMHRLYPNLKVLDFGLGDGRLGPNGQPLPAAPSTSRGRP